MRKKYLIATIIIVFTASILTILALKKIPEKKPTISYHGPNPNYQFEVKPSVNVTPTSEPTQKIPTPTAPTEVPSSKPTTTSAEYGIAAGGVLTSMNQDTINAYLDKLSELGVGWIRWDIDWAFTQKNGSQSYDWSGIDKVVNSAKKYNIKSLVTVAYAPRWAAMQPCTYPGCSPTDPKEYGIFAGKVAERYNGLINYFEIWNEPNYPLFWSKPDTVRYTEVLKEAYNNIKTVNPNSVVISGGLAASENGQDGSISPLSFIESLYNLKANNYFDAVALHPYTYPVTPSYVANWNHWQEMSKIRSLMDRNGDSSKKIWITEYGASTGGPGSQYEPNHLQGYNYGSDFMSEEGQAILLKDAIKQYSQNNLRLGPFFWYSLQDLGTNRNTPENFFGLLRFDGSAKPSYNVFQNALSKK